MRWQSAFRTLVTLDLGRRLQRIRLLQSAPDADGVLTREVHAFGHAAALPTKLPANRFPWFPLSVIA